jgi:mitogen-activated protein kinase 1/3
MLSGKPLFPGRDYHHQLTLILDVLGTPTLDEFYAITTRRSRDYIRALPFRKKKAFQTIFPNANPLAIDFLTKTLVLDCPFCIIIAQRRHSLRRLTRRSALPLNRR